MAGRLHEYISDVEAVLDHRGSPSVPHRLTFLISRTNRSITEWIPWSKAKYLDCIMGYLQAREELHPLKALVYTPDPPEVTHVEPILNGIASESQNA